MMKKSLARPSKALQEFMQRLNRAHEGMHTAMRKLQLDGALSNPVPSGH